ncbi:hypothetical protein KJ682_08765 [bacterium]|nr:hypothetical protein [bacterium]
MPHTDGRKLTPENLPKATRTQVDLYKVFTEYDLKREVRATWHTLVKRLPWIVAFICLAVSIHDLAGENTRVALSAWIVGLSPSIKISWTLTGALTVLLGGREWNYRKTILRIGRENKELEIRLDPGRTPSDLAEDGSTKEEDK